MKLLETNASKPRLAVINQSTLSGKALSSICHKEAESRKLKAKNFFKPLAFCFQPLALALCFFQVKLYAMHLLMAAFLIVLDQVVKEWVVATYPLGGSGQYVGLGFYFTYVQNTGAAFSLFRGNPFALGMLSAVVAAAILVYLVVSWKAAPTLQRYALSSILAGAIGNMIDRFRLGYVVDFIHFSIPQFNFAVFNIADSCVVIGAILLIGSGLFQKRKQESGDGS
jgi:signal peptidase II